jgi:hypothetical protein
MTRRRKIAVAGIVVALALAAGVGIVAAIRSRPLEPKLEQVRYGMTYAEVVGILGEPCTPGWKCHTWTKVWEDRRLQAFVWFDGDPKIVTAVGRRFLPVEQTGLLDRVLAWLGL